MYSLFAFQRLRISDEIFDTQYQLLSLQEKSLNLSSLSTIFADGNLTPGEIQQSNYYVQNGIASAINMGNAMNAQAAQAGVQTQMIFRNPMNPNIIQMNDQLKVHTKAQIAQQEKDINQQVKRLEIKLAKLEKDEEQIVKQMEKSLERSTVKYGLA